MQGVSKLNLANIIQTKMGSNFASVYDQQNEHDINDPSLEEVQQQYVLENQNKLRNLCAAKKKIYNNADYYDFELQRKMEVQDDLIKNLKTCIPSPSLT